MRNHSKTQAQISTSSAPFLDVWTTAVLSILPSRYGGTKCTCQLFGFGFNTNMTSLYSKSKMERCTMWLSVVQYGLVQCPPPKKKLMQMDNFYIVILWLGGELYLIPSWLQRHQNYSNAGQCRNSHLLAPLEHSKLRAKVPPPEGTGLTTKEWKYLE